MSEIDKTKRDYTTWEEDFTSDRCELHGYNSELVAVIDSFPASLAPGGWTVKDKNGKIITLKKSKQEAMKSAEGTSVSINIETSRQMTSTRLIAEKYGENEANGKCREWNQTGKITCGGPDTAISGLTYLNIRPDNGGGLILVPQDGRLEIYCG